MCVCKRKRAVVYAFIARLCNVPEPLHYLDQRGLGSSAGFLFNKVVQNGSHATDWTLWQDASQPPKKIQQEGLFFLPVDSLPSEQRFPFYHRVSHVCQSSLSTCEDIPHWLVIYLRGLLQKLRACHNPQGHKCPCCCKSKEPKNVLQSAENPFNNFSNKYCPVLSKTIYLKKL